MFKIVKVVTRCKSIAEFGSLFEGETIEVKSENAFEESLGAGDFDLLIKLGDKFLVKKLSL